MRLSLPVTLIVLLNSVFAEFDNEHQQHPFVSLNNNNDVQVLDHHHAQTPHHHSPHDSSSSSLQPTTASTTLIDLLSADGNYTRLITLLQNTRLIPTFNRLNGVTFFAPTNDAIEKHELFRVESEKGYYHDKHEYYYQEEDLDLFLNDGERDNIHEELRQQLLYHVLDTRLEELPNELKVHKTYLYPHPITGNHTPSTPPWIPKPGGTLGGEPQRIRVSASGNTSWVATDFEGKGGIEIIRPLVTADNGVLIGIGNIIEPPPNLITLIESHNSLSYFTKILSKELRAHIETGSSITYFLPQNSAWDTLNDIERLYLESEYSDDDVRRVLDLHSVKAEEKEKNPVRWSDTWSNNTNRKIPFIFPTPENETYLALVTNVNGDELQIVFTPDSRTLISGVELLHPDIYASNGVIHLVSSLLFPDALTLTPEKYLLALNCTHFVSLIRSVSLSHLVNDTSKSYTILAPRDDVWSLHQSDDDSFPPSGSKDLAKYMKYHFLPGKWTPENLRDGMLLETALDEEGLAGKFQVLSVGVTPETKTLSFGGSGVIGENPIEVYNTIIYFITKPLTPPSDVWQTALPSLQFSAFIASVFSTSLAERLKIAQATTFLIPQNAAFERLGLVSKYLLRATNTAKNDLEKVVLHHIIDGVEYAQALVKGTQKSYPTLEGSDLHMRRADNGTLWITPSGGWSNLQGKFMATVGGGTGGGKSGSGGTSQTFAGNGVADLLTRTGVIHEVDAVFIPRTVDITLDKLADAADGSTMAGVVSKAGLGWILNGTKPPADTGLGEWNQILKWRVPTSDTGDKQRQRRQREYGIILDDVVGWVLLCPTETAFKGVNMTQLWADKDMMRRLVAQHLIPLVVPPSSSKSKKEFLDGGKDDNPSSFSSSDTYKPISFGNKATYSTILSQDSFYGDITFRLVDEKDESKGYIVGIKDARGTDGKNDWANVLGWGRSTFRRSSSNNFFAGAVFETPTEGGVIQIDHLLVPYEPQWWIKYGPPGIVLLFGSFFIGIFFFGVRRFWKRESVEATYEPIGGFAGDDDD